MDFSSTKLFIEILICGVLFSFAISPFLILRARDPERLDALLPGASAWKDKTLTVVLAVAILYTLGVAGNRLAGQADKFSSFKASNDTELVELVVRDHGDAAERWVERQKPWLRLLRAAAASSILGLIGMPVYRRWGETRARYLRRHLIAASVCILAFTGGYLLEATHYRDNLCSYFRVIQVKDPKNYTQSVCAMPVHPP